MKGNRITLSLLLILALLVPSFAAPPVVSADPDPWWNASWDYRNILAFNASGIGENLYYFPVLVQLSAANHFDFDKIAANGTDIRFIDKLGSDELPYEIDTWDDVNETATVWVRVPQIDANSDYSDYFWIYYGNAAAADAQDAEEVWQYPDSTFADDDGTAEGSPVSLVSGAAATSINITGAGNFTVTLPAGATGTVASGTANVTGTPVTLLPGPNAITVEDTGTITASIGGFAAVYHMNDSPDNSSIILDSTANGNHGTKGAGSAAPTEVAGVVGKTQQYVRTDHEYIVTAAATHGLTNQISLIWFAKPDAVNVRQYVFYKSDNWVMTASDEYGRITFRFWDALGNIKTNHIAVGLSAGEWATVIATFDGTTVTIYKNGTSIYTSSADAGTIRDTSAAVYIGADGVAAMYGYGGLADEAMVCSAALTPDEVKALDAALRGDSLLYYGNEDPPPSVSTLAATGVSMNAAGVTSGTFNGNLTSLGGAPTCNATFEYGPTIAFGTSTAVQLLNATGTYSASIPADLTPGETYYYRASATNVDGTGTGDNMSFTFTMPTVVTLAAQDVHMDAGGTSAVLRGQITDMGAAATSTVFFEWDYDTTYSNVVGTDTANAPGTFTYTLTGFNPSKTVYYRFVAQNGAVLEYGSAVSVSEASETGYILLRIIPMLVIMAVILMVYKQRGGDAFEILGTVFFGVLLFLAVIAILESMW